MHPAIKLFISGLGLTVISLIFVNCSPRYSAVAPVIGPKDTAESILGERLFREPRFSKYFARQSGGNPNARLTHGDPALEKLPSPRRGDLSSPFARQAMSCAACHFVDDAQNIARGGIRGYADFAARSPSPNQGLDPTRRPLEILQFSLAPSFRAMSRFCSISTVNLLELKISSSAASPVATLDGVLMRNKKLWPT